MWTSADGCCGSSWIPGRIFPVEFSCGAEMNSKRFFLVLVLATFLSQSVLLVAEDWPRFRGPNGNGVSSAKTVPTRWKESDFNWATDLPGEGHGSPVVVGSRVFLLCGDPFTADRIVLCLDASTGRINWNRRFKSAPHYLHRDNNYAASTPAADGKGVVACWTTPKKFTLVALSNSGEKIWQRDFGEYKSAWGGAASPIIVDDLVIILNDQMDPKIMARFLPEGTQITEPGNSLAIAVDRNTGETRWTSVRRTVIAGYATPCVRELENGKKELVFFGTGNGMSGLDLKTGKTNWELPRSMPSRTVMSPVLAGNLVIGSYGSGLVGDRLVAVRLPSQNRKAEVAFQLKQSIPLVPTALYRDGLLFLTCETGVLSCVQLETRKVLWKERHRGKFYASPVCVDGRLYCADRRGNVVVIAARAPFEKLAINPLGDDCYATPAIANGAIFFRTRSRLISIGGP